MQARLWAFLHFINYREEGGGGRGIARGVAIKCLIVTSVYYSMNNCLLRRVLAFAAAAAANR